MVRVDWLRKRHLSDTSQRGDNRFVRVSWDEALDMFYEELERVQKTHGPSALLTASGWQSTGMFHNASGCWRKLLPCMVIALVRAEITLPVLRR
ncbi:molybdopterin-dependent oxidoreductase [Escherichia coli]|nr:molybdopterin-dependent oxidoreductase [Escherichia coli]